MQMGIIEWKMEANKLLNSIRIKGTLLSGENFLIIQALEILDIAQKNNGNPVPLIKFPDINEKNEFIYFEIIFKSKEDLTKFIDEINRRFK